MIEIFYHDPRREEFLPRFLTASNVPRVLRALGQVQEIDSHLKRGRGEVCAFCVCGRALVHLRFDV